MRLAGKDILLVIAGGIAAYKSLDLIRRLREQGASVRCVLTAGGAQFVTPLAVAAVSEQPTVDALFALDQHAGMSHIRLSRESDLIVVAPATADLMAKMAVGLADDLAATLLLAADKPVLLAPAMNVRMWQHPATMANVATLERRGIQFVGPGSGSLACGETGDGRMADVADIVAAIERHVALTNLLAGRRALVTSGPTWEPIDPVRYIANRSSGRQGHAIAEALQQLGAAVTLISGPVQLSPPPGVTVIAVETAVQMRDAAFAALPADIAVCAAAVADWRVAVPAAAKHKKHAGAAPPVLELIANPDILAELAASGPHRPTLVAGFAAETENLIDNGRAKLHRKGCDVILANDVSVGSTTFGGADNQVHVISASGVETWPSMSKEAVARRLAHLLAERLAQSKPRSA